MIAVLHNGAKSIEDPLYVMAKDYGSVQIKTEKLGNNKDIQTMSIKDYFRACRENYNSSSGTCRFGPIRAISIVGKTGEEVSIYHETYLKSMEKIPILNCLLPWGKMSNTPGVDPMTSNDGPIMWARPGEQIFQPNSDTALSTKKRKILIGCSQTNKDGSGTPPSREFPTNTGTMRTASGSLIFPGMGMATDFSHSGIRRRDTREKFIQDFTPAHADHVDEPHIRQTGWAVGVLKHPNYTKKEGPNRAVKRVICFDARSFYDMIEPMELNLMNNPADQCNKFIDQQRLNYLRSMGIKYAEFDLYHNDIYILPRYVIHQFRSTGHVVSMAWHVRIKEKHLRIF